jgi:hypothetical protein
MKEPRLHELAGSCVLWPDRWKAVTEHSPTTVDVDNSRKVRRQLFHADEDRSAAHHLT